MWRWRLAGIAGVGLLIAAAVIYFVGRNGGGTVFHASATENCVEDEGGVIGDRDDLDIIAEAARAGAFSATINGNEVTVMFERTSKDAERSYASYRLFAAALDTPVDDILSRHGNAVIAWDNTPSDSEQDLVRNCLTE